MPSSPTLSEMMATTTAQAQHNVAWKAGVLGTLNVLMIVVAVRLIVLVAVAGGIGLTWLALQSPDPFRLGALMIYCSVVVVPTIWLAGRR